jgi:uncharacterized protein (DUF1501 family)
MANRRKFLKSSLPLMTLPVVLKSMPVFAFKPKGMLQAISNYANERDRVLVLIQLNGGNDGLNTLIPLDQYTNYRNARTNIAIPEPAALKLNALTGLHPSMSGLFNLRNDGKLGILQSVGYPNPNFSHFRATDIWTSASDSNVIETTGWVGRYLGHFHPQYPNGYPSDQNPDPLALTIGSVVSHTCQGPISNMGLAVSSSDFAFDFNGGINDPLPENQFGNELGFVRDIMRQTNQYADRVQAAFDKAQNQSTKYPASRLAEQLKIVARLIAGGLSTKIYVVNIGGFDTHGNQVAGTTATTTGTHANLLADLSSSIEGFMDDLRRLGKDEKVLGITFSEFGRRIRSNNSMGTDHGSAAPLFVFGNEVNPIIHGSNPVIPANPAQNESIPMQFDFRDIYASILKDWFDADDTLIGDMFNRTYTHLPIIGRVTGIRAKVDPEFILYQNYPNPFSHQTFIKFYSMGGAGSLRIIDSSGREVSKLLEGPIPAGEQTLLFESEHLKPGVYIMQLQVNRDKISRSMLLKR